MGYSKAEREKIKQGVTQAAAQQIELEGQVAMLLQVLESLGGTDVSSLVSTNLIDSCKSVPGTMFWGNINGLTGEPVLPRTMVGPLGITTFNVGSPGLPVTEPKKKTK